MDTGAQDAALGAIRARWRAVSPGPWRYEPPPYDSSPAGVTCPDEDEWIEVFTGQGGDVAEVHDQYHRANGIAIAHAPADVATLLDALEAAESRQAALVALAHELTEMEHGARAEQMQALHRLGVVVTLDEHLARARAFADKQHARIDALAALGEGGDA